MCILLLGLLLALSQEGSKAASPLVGKWVSTVKPGPGEAPAIAPTFTIAMKDNKFLVSIEGEKDPLGAVAFRASKTETLLVIRTAPAGQEGRLIVIRPVAANQVRFELFNEYPAGGRRTNFYYAEVFKREAD